MAFWGVEVKPGKPITHSYESGRGRLRISQATLGIGENPKKGIVQCNVGNKSPVVLCVLLPNQTESCHLDLEFQEAEDVVFSVIGPRSVYLTGYYVRQSYHSNPHSDTESYGVDIENSQNEEGSSYRSDDDNYEDSFINDDDGFQFSPRDDGMQFSPHNDALQFSPHSPVSSSKEMDEITPENDKLKDKKGRGKKLKKKKYQVIESDDDARAPDTEDEAALLLSLSSKRATKIAVSDSGEENAQVTVKTSDEAKDDDGTYGTESKQREATLPMDEVVKNDENEPPKEMQTLDENITSNEILTDDTIHQKNTENTSIDHNLPMSNGEDQMQSPELEKSKKKRKRSSRKKQKTREVEIDTDNVLGEDKGHEVEASKTAEIDVYSLASPPESGSEQGKKSKKRKNKLQSEGIGEKSDISPKDDKLEQDVPHTDSLTKDLPEEKGEFQEQQIDKETDAYALASLPELGSERVLRSKKRRNKLQSEGTGEKSDNIPKDDKPEQDVLHADNLTKDLPAEKGESQEHQIDNNINTTPEILADDSEPEKQMKKTQEEDMPKSTNTPEITTPMKNENESTNSAQSQQRTLPNGLIIQELAIGRTDGKVAALDKKVKIFYTGMLKESGHVFDSNVGKIAFKFRLGDSEFIDGWNIGIDGMHVGDKRRLIIPPSLGFGDNAVGDKVPPNSWLVYDIELVGVHR